MLLHYTPFAIRRQKCLKKIGHDPSGGQIVKSQKISVLCSFAGLIQGMGIVSVYQLELRHLFFGNSIFNFIKHDF